MKKESGIKMGWLVAMFDLPVKTTIDRKIANEFKKNLKEHGFFMLQFSVYARSCVSHEIYEREIKILKQLAPTTGNINIIYITDIQWEKMIYVQGTNEKYTLSKKKMPNQIEFW